jgi:hypothetical protein
MANEMREMLEGKWYNDNHMNLVASAIRQRKGLADKCSYLLNTPVNDVHVLILDVVNGQHGATVDAGNLVRHLNKHRRATGSNFLIILQHIYTIEEFNQHNIDALMEDTYSHISAEETAAIYRTLEEVKYKKAKLKTLLETEASKATGTDPFDEMASHLKKEKAEFRILFPLNLGEFEPGKSGTGFHWVLGEIEIIKTGNKIKANCFKRNSFGNGEFSPEEILAIAPSIQSRLKEILGEDIVVDVQAAKNTDPKRQLDASSCGPITCRDLELRAEGKPVGEPVPNGAAELRMKQYQMVTGHKAEVKIPKQSAARNNIFAPDETKKIKQAFDKVFKGGNKAELKEENKCHKIVTTDLTDENLRDFVQKTIELVKALGYTGAVEMNAPTDKKEFLRDLCKGKLNITEPVQERRAAMASA